MAVEYSENWQENFFWLLVLAWLGSAFMAFGLGANDCANAYGTSVGSGVLKLWQAYAMATVFEILGAGLLGYQVTETIRKLIVDVKIYDIFAVQLRNGTEICLAESCDFGASVWSQCPKMGESFQFKNAEWLNTQNWTDSLSSPNKCAYYSSAEFMLGEFCSMLGAGAWLIFATWLKAPVSTTHSAVGATIGFTLVLKGSQGVSWSNLLWERPMIIPSWIISPVLTGIVAVIFYTIVRLFVLHRKNPFEASLQMLPFCYFATVSINVYAIVFGGSKYLGFNLLNWWQVLLIALGMGVVAWLIAFFIIKPRIRDWVLKTSPKGILVKSNPEFDY